MGFSRIYFNMIKGIILLLSLGLLHIDQPSSATICEIQGDSFVSPLLGEEVSAQGLVTLDLDQSWQRGFYMQYDECDGDAATSDGIFVYLGAQGQVVNQGDWVEVSGTVGEFYGLTEIITEPDRVSLVSQGHALPSSISMDPPYDNAAARLYFETLEGMVAGLEQAVVVGPTDGDDRTWLVHAGLGIERVFYDDPQGTGELVCVDDSGPYEITPEVKVPDHVNGLAGVLDFRGGFYCLQLVAPPVVITAGQGIQAAPDDLAFTLATFNLENLFDTVDDEGVEDEILGPTEYQRRLHKRALAIQTLGLPHILAVQEAEKREVLEELVSQAEISADYEILFEDGPDRRGLDLALLYRTEYVQVLDYQVRQGCTILVDGLGPDGTGDVLNPVNKITCDSDGDSILDGNRLFSRPPLVAHLRVCPEGCQGIPANEPELWILVHHWKSKSQDTASVQYTLPRRVEQAYFVAALLDEILAVDPRARLVVMGDLNDYHDSEPVQVLISHGLHDLLVMADKSEQYTYVYHGLSQALDYLLVFQQPGLAAAQATPLHVNADYPHMYMTITDSLHRSSDHDPVKAQFELLRQVVYLPVTIR